MKNKTFRLMGLSAATLFCLGLPVMGQEVSIHLTGGYTGVFGSDEAGIYSATINGASSPGVICDDFKDEEANNATWNATAIQASSLASGSNLNNTLFGKTIGITGYAEIATLVNMMFGNLPHTYYGITINQAEISSAIWDITTPGGISGLDWIAQDLVSAVENLFCGSDGSTLAANYLDTLTNLWILTPDPKTGVGSGEPQEMWTEGLTVPEGGAALLYLLLAGFTCFGAMYYSRDRAKASLI